MEIHEVIDRWHDYLGSGDPAILDELLHDDCVFISPVVFTPQRGKEVTTMYLLAAGSSLGGEDERSAVTAEGGADRSFRYVKKVLAGPHAVLEFETWIGDVSVNGVDIITIDEEGKIIEFKVMIRPLKGLDAVHAQMKQTLDRMGALG